MYSSIAFTLMNKEYTMKEGLNGAIPGAVNSVVSEVTGSEMVLTKIMVENGI